jgi:hypothetical protein
MNKAQHFLSKHGRSAKFRDRTVFFKISSQEELMDALFPQAAKNRSRVKPHSRVPSDAPIVFVQRFEINALLSAAKTPSGGILVAFDNIISLLTKIPWQKLQGVTTSQRDHMFELCKRILIS